VKLEHDWYPADLPTAVSIGERSWLYSSYAFLHFASEDPRAVTIGDDTGVYVGTLFDLGSAGTVEIGRYCSIVGPIISTNARVTIGDYVLIAHAVVLADDPFATPGMGSSSSRRPRGDIVIDDGVWIGANTVVLGPVHIGTDAIIAAGSVVDADVPPGATWAGNPGRVVRTGVNRMD
jgi:acetyltransferase-like isoleucine patch superfamily enzyme